MSAQTEVTGELLRQLPYWEHLSAEERELIAQHALCRKYKKGQFIFGCRSDCLGMICVLRGTVRAYLLSESGREITLFRLHKGDPCVLSASCVMRQITFDTQMNAEEDCELLIVRSSAFARVVEQNIHVRCFLYEMAAERFSSVMWTLQEVLFKGYDARLASFLLAESERLGSNEIRMTHEQLAQNTSSAREVVARMLKRFIAEGLVEARRGTVILKDRQALREIAEQ